MASFVRVTGVQKVVDNLAAVGLKYRKALQAALYTEAVGLVAATDPFVPVVTQRLRNSHYAQPKRGYAGGEPWVKVGYAAPYAAAVHERTDLHHPRGQSKFLRAGLNIVLPGLSNRIARSTEANVAENATIANVVTSIPASPRTAIGGRARVHGKAPQAGVGKLLDNLLRKARKGRKRGVSK